MININQTEIIKNYRKKRGMTQKQLAQKTGLSIATIQGYEQGKYKPKIDSIKKIANALNVSPLDLNPTIADTKDVLDRSDVFPNKLVVSMAEYVDMRDKPLTAYFDAWLVASEILFKPAEKNGVKGFFFCFDSMADFINGDDEKCYFVTEKQFKDIRNITIGYVRKLIKDSAKINESQAE